MHRQPEAGKLFPNLRFPLPEQALVVSEEQKVIDVRHVGATSQPPLDVLVQLVEIDVGSELADEVADRKAARALDGEQVVAGEVDHPILVPQDLGPVVQNEID
jgi:hypothetical protein